MARPPMKRIQASIGCELENAQPAAEIRNRTAISINVGRRPKRSEGHPTPNAPKIVPINAPETVKPCQKPESWNSFWIAFSQPEITPESKPNKNPPKAETITIYSSAEFVCFVRETVFAIKETPVSPASRRTSALLSSLRCGG